VRVANYDNIAGGYDRRYALHDYAGVAEALTNFLPQESPALAVLEVGCGTGHWLASLIGSASLSRLRWPDNHASFGEARRSAEGAEAAGGRRILAGVEPSSEMIARARAAAPAARLVRGRAEGLPWRDATFDRIYCVNALHHFADRMQFFLEARRILKPGGGLLTIGKDPHVDRDAWWVYEYFPETLEIDRRRFARVRTLRGEMALAGFAWTESFECDRIEALMPAGDALATGVVDRAYTSQLTVLSNEEFDAGVARIREANEAAGGRLQLAADFWLYATIGWV
jgi:ubiquinone/menaquinone biosynthesis C-methylase UbiE